MPDKTKDKTAETRNRTTRKAATSVTLTPKKKTAPSAPKISAKTATLSAPAQPVTAKSVMKKGELVDQVVERTGIKKRDAKAAVEATLSVMSAALANETDLNLPPMGKLRAVKFKPIDGGAQVMTLKLRTMKDKPSDTAAED